MFLMLSAKRRKQRTKYLKYGYFKHFFSYFKHPGNFMITKQFPFTDTFCRTHAIQTAFLST